MSTSLSAQITRLSNAKAALRTSIQNKGVSVSRYTTLDGYASLINSIVVGVEEINTNAAMKARLSSTYVGSIYKYTGTTDTDFINGELYQVTKVNSSYVFYRRPETTSTVSDITIKEDESVDVIDKQTVTASAYLTWKPGVIALSGSSVFYSNNGADGSVISNTTVSYPRDITYGKGTYVCVGKGSSGDLCQMCYSTDRLSWTSVTSGFAPEYQAGGVTYGDNRFVYINGSAGYYSFDGITWVAMSGGGASTGCSGPVAYGNGRYIAVFSSTGYYSTNGTSWTQMSGSLRSGYVYYRMAYGLGKFVCVGGDFSSCAYYSANGTSWSSCSGITAVSGALSVAYGNNRFVVITEGGSSYYSTNGTSWVSAGSIISAQKIEVNDIVYGDGKFYCGGRYIPTSSTAGIPLGLLAYSTDGTSWTLVNGSGGSYKEYATLTHNSWRDY